jgi:hypothetical protein
VAISAGKGVWREKFRFLVISAGFARLKTRLLPTKCRSTFRRCAPAASALPLVLGRVHWVRPELVAEVKYLTWTDDNLLRQVVYEGLREEAGGRPGSPAGAALTTLTASLNDQIGPYRRWEWAFMGRIGINVAGPVSSIATTRKGPKVC